ncbi:MAG: hypothetical protein QME68_00620 [Elusimicrobiota bacterium]|nr:hypothetical protein [Elusimicrobiota bacterium]
MNIKEYYSNKIIKERIAQYCGGELTNLDGFSSVYLVGLHNSFHPIKGQYFFAACKSDFFSLLERGVDIFRSIWDEKAVLCVIDVDYVNLNYPGEAFFNPEQSFRKLEPVYCLTKNLLEKFAIDFLAIMTGQGYHFVFKVPVGVTVITHSGGQVLEEARSGTGTGQSNRAFEQLYKIGKIESSLEGKYSSTHGRRMSVVPKEVALAYDGAGRIIEYFVHLVMKGLKDYIGIPVTFFDVACGNKEMIVFDLSMYADPIYMRDIRCPFSVYQKHKLFKDKFGDDTSSQTPFFISLPRNSNTSLEELLRIRTDFAESIKYAEKAQTEIPDASNGVMKLIKSYKASKVRKFHKYFDLQEHDHWTVWNETYDLLNLNTLPPCVSHCLKYPNDHLLKPTNIQTLTRVLLKLNWHPKHIAGLIRSKYERNYNWGEMWFKYDAATRANLYVRIFSALLLTGLDKEEDLNCSSHKEKGYCLKKGEWCNFNLADYKIARL